MAEQNIRPDSEQARFTSLFTQPQLGEIVTPLASDPIAFKSLLNEALENDVIRSFIVGDNSILVQRNVGGKIFTNTYSIDGFMMSAGIRRPEGKVPSTQRQFTYEVDQAGSIQVKRIEDSIIKGANTIVLSRSEVGIDTVEFPDFPEVDFAALQALATGPDPLKISNKIGIPEVFDSLPQVLKDVVVTQLSDTKFQLAIPSFFDTPGFGQALRIHKSILERFTDVWRVSEDAYEWYRTTTGDSFSNPSTNQIYIYDQNNRRTGVRIIMDSGLGYEPVYSDIYKPQAISTPQGAVTVFDIERAFYRNGSWQPAELLTFMKRVVLRNSNAGKRSTFDVTVSDYVETPNGELPLFVPGEQQYSVMRNPLLPSAVPENRRLIRTIRIGDTTVKTILTLLDSEEIRIDPNQTPLFEIVTS